MEHTTHIPHWTLGDRLEKARKDTGLTQKEFAARLLVSERTVQNYEKGSISHPKKLVLEKWAEQSGVPYWWLAGSDEPSIVGGRSSGWTYGAEVIDLDDWARRSDPIYVPGQIDLFAKDAA